MCPNIQLQTRVSGSARAGSGWFRLERSRIAYDCPTHANGEHALILDFVDASGGLDRRCVVELTIDSARDLGKALVAAAREAQAYEAA
jgi:hypothetical protein